MKVKAQKGKLAFIFYENETHPRYYEISRPLVRILLIGLPIITLVSLVLVLVGTAYFKELKLMAEKKEPMIIKELRQKNIGLVKRFKEVGGLNLALQNKLTSNPVSDLDSLSLFKPVKGQEDKTHTPLISINDVKYRIGQNSLDVEFIMANLTKEQEKLAGFVIVILKSKNGLFYYPLKAIQDDDIQMAFNQGEYFAFSRFRPVKASFNTTNKVDDFMVKILIFSRTGDLIHKKMILKPNA